MKTLTKLFAIVWLSLGLTTMVKAQQGIGTNAPDKSAVVDMTATNKGALLPRVALTGTTDVTTIASPANSLTVFNTATAGTAPNAVTPGYYYWSTPDAKWIRLIDKESDLRLVGIRSHITQDAGVGGNGTSPGTGTAADNIGIGYLSLSSNINGFQNLAIGSRALQNSTAGVQNVAIGGNTLTSTTAGFYNTAIGVAALSANTTGNFNVASGFSTLQASTTGEYNTALGYIAGFNLTTGSNNLAIGANTLFASPTASNQMNIGNTIFGTGMNGSVTSPAGLVGINTAAPSNTLHVKATANPLRLEGLQTGASTDNVVVADANGVLKSVARSIFTGDLRLVGTGSHITQDAGVGGNGTSVGTGTYNIAIGPLTLYSNTSGFNNIAIGDRSLSNNTSGINNTAIGRYNLVNSTGSNNTAIGNGILYNSTTGSNNTAIGNGVLYANTTGSNNTASGAQSLYNNTTGTDNIAYGYLAGNNITTGSNNFVVGNNVNIPSATADNQMNIKNTIFGTGMSGTIASPAGLVGINVTAPSNTLHVKATTNPLRLEGLQTGATTDNMVVADATGVLKTVSRATSSIVTVNANYTVLATDRTLIADATTAGFTITLPAANVNTGRELFIRKADETTNVLTFSLSLKYSATTNITTVNSLSTWHIQSDGTNWWVIGKTQ